MNESPPEQLYEHTLHSSHEGKSGAKQAAIYMAAGAGGIGAAVNKLHHTYHGEVKGRPGFDLLYQARKDEQNLATNGKTNSAAEYRAMWDSSEAKYRKAYGELLLKERGIHSGGVKGWTVGSWQRWRVSGPHTRRDVLFSLATTGIISLGALMLMDRSHPIVQELGDKGADKSGAVR